MSERSFKWLDADEADSLLQQQIERSTDQGEIVAPFIDIPEDIDLSEGEMQSVIEPRRLFTRYYYDTRRHLDEMNVIGASTLTEEDVRRMGPLLARDDSYREDAIFHILHQRRAEVQPYLRRFVTVKVKHMVMHGLAAQASRLSPDKIQTNYTTRARELFEPIVEPDELQDNLLGSDFQRRVLRTLFYILSEPSGSARRFTERLQERARTSKLSAEELLVQTFGFVSSQAEQHRRSNPLHLETEETMIKLIEQQRLIRLEYLGKTVLAHGLGLVLGRQQLEE